MIPKYRSDIDGLRAVAVALVVAFHAFPGVVSGGFIGVDVFFVISGYLITGIILSDLESSEFTFARFYARRTRRIVPALVVVIAATLAVGWLQLLPAKYQGLGRYGFAGALFFPNFLSWSEVGYFDAAAEAKPLLHLWSLGVEEQFYLIWPLFLLLLNKSARSLAGLSALVVASLVYSCFAVRYDPAAAFYAPWSRLWELGVGGILARTNWRAQGRDWISYLGIVLIVGSAVLLRKTSPFPGLLALLPVTGTSLIIVFGSRILGHKWPVFVGLISYPLYLWHWPLLSFAAIAGLTSIPVRVALVITSVVLAVLTTRLIEYPLRFGFLKRRGVGISMAAMMVVIGLSAVIWRSGGVPGRYPDEIQAVLATMQYDPASNARVLKCWLTAESTFESFAPECSAGATLIWGDSHAGRLYAGLKRDGIDIAQFTKDSCPPSTGGTYPNCATSNAAVLRRIAELKPQTVILFAGWARYEHYFQADVQDNGLSAALIELKKSVQDVIVIGQGPLWYPDLPTQVYEFWRANGRLPDRLPPQPLPYQRINDALAAMSAKAGARFVSSFEDLCNEGGCLTHTQASQGDLLTWDYGHPTIAGARFMGTFLHLN
ncbi:acyltransferase family protein [Bradyrhizobium sp. UFLA05-153]